MRIVLFLLVLLFPFNSFSLENTEKQAVQKSMKDYVKQILGENDIFPVIHKGKIIELKLHKTEKYPDGFHAGVKNTNDLYTSCADFKDADGNIYDIDFLVKKSSSGYQVIQPLVHSINGEKNPYDLEH